MSLQEIGLNHPNCERPNSFQLGLLRQWAIGEPQFSMHSLNTSSNFWYSQHCILLCQVFCFMFVLKIFCAVWIGSAIGKFLFDYLFCTLDYHMKKGEHKMCQLLQVFLVVSVNYVRVPNKRNILLCGMHNDTRWFRISLKCIWSQRTILHHFVYSALKSRLFDMLTDNPVQLAHAHAQPKPFDFVRRVYLSFFCEVLRNICLS